MPKACFATSLGKTRKIKLLRQIKAHGLQFNLFEYPLQMEMPSMFTSMVVKTCKMKQKQAVCPVASLLDGHSSVVTGPLCTVREKL